MKGWEMANPQSDRLNGQIADLVPVGLMLALYPNTYPNGQKLALDSVSSAI